MINVKKHGQITRLVKHWENAICPCCKCEFSCDDSDNEKFWYSNYITVTCPDCGVAVHLDYANAESIETIQKFGE